MTYDEAQQLYEIYKAGQMDPEDAASFELSLKTGQDADGNPVIVPEFIQQQFFDYAAGNLSEDDQELFQKNLKEGVYQIGDDPIITNEVVRAANKANVERNYLNELKALEQAKIEAYENSGLDIASGVLRGVGGTAAAAGTGALIGAAVGGPAAPVTAPAGALIAGGLYGLGRAGSDLGTMAYNYATGSDVPGISELEQRAFDAFGIPRAQGKAAQYAQTLSNIAADTAVGAAGAKAAAAGIKGTGKLASRSKKFLEGMGQETGRQVAAATTGYVGGEVAGESAEALGASPQLSTAARLGISLITGELGSRAYGSKATTAQKSAELSKIESGIEASEQMGVGTTTSMAYPPTGSAQSLESASAQIPFFGTGATHAKIAQQRQDATEKIIKKYGMTETLDNLSSDAEQFVADVAEGYGKRRKYIKNNLQEQKEKVISSIPGKVETKRLDDYIDERLSKLERDTESSALEQENVLLDIQKMVKGVDGEGFTLSEIEKKRKDLSQSYKDSNAGQSLSLKEQELNKAYGILVEDMGDHIKTYGSETDYKQWKGANKKLSNLAKDNNLRLIRKLIAETTIDEKDGVEAVKNAEEAIKTVSNILLNKTSKSAEKLYESLSAADKRKARSAIVLTLAEKALRDSKTASSKAVDVSRFAKLLDAYPASKSIFFKGKAKQEAEFFKRMASYTSRSESLINVPNTGGRNTLMQAYVALSAMLGLSGATTMRTTPIVGALATAGLGTLSRVYESKPVLNLLRAISHTKVGTKEELRAVKRLIASLRSLGSEAQEGKKDGN